MTCKLARIKKKHFKSIIIKDNKNNRVGFFKRNRSYRERLRFLTLFNPRDKLNYEYHYDKVEFHNNNLHVRDINFGMILKVPRYASSKVKRSRIKNILQTYYGFTLEKYNNDAGKNYNPVFIYHMIMSRKEHDMQTSKKKEETN